MKEWTHLRANPSPDYCIEPVNDTDMFLWRAIITGPKGSPYEGGIFPLSIRIPKEYPFHSPKVRYLVNVYNPAINCNGTVCHFMLRDHWKPSYLLEKLVQELRRDLEHVQEDEPMVPEIAHVYKTNRALFWKTAREWTQLFASPMSECTNYPC